jgi:DNA-binding NarL/FixJ family response regulator
MEQNTLGNQKIRVAVVDDHQSALDSYTYRLSTRSNIEIVGSARYGNDLLPLLENTAVDVLVLDIGVPNSPEDRNPYPILFLLPELLKKYAELAILVISMHDQRTLVKAVLEAGASGYILKEDREAIVQLADAVTLINTGGIYVSKQLRDVLAEGERLSAPHLSKRQREALSLAAAYPDIKTEELGARLNIAPSTLRNLLSKAYKTLKVRNRSAATQKARDLGLISPFTEYPQVKE